jgi:hypothetical protein
MGKKKDGVTMADLATMTAQDRMAVMNLVKVCLAILFFIHAPSQKWQPRLPQK